MNDADFKLYVIAEMNYKKKNDRKHDKELFPPKWYSNYDYKFKVNVLAEAMKKNILIRDTDLYKNMLLDIK